MRPCASTSTPTRRRRTAPSHPREVVAAAAAAGLDVVALTDHDTTAGWAEAAAAARRARHRAGARDRGVGPRARDQHPPAVLPAGPDAPGAHRRAGQDARRARSAARGRSSSCSRSTSRSPGTTCSTQSRDAVVVGRPHIADALVALGIVPDRDAAFAHLPARRRPVPRARTTPPTGPTPCARSGPPAACPSSRTPAPTPAAGSCRTRVFDRLAAAGLGGHRGGPPRPLARRSASG